MRDQLGLKPGEAVAFERDGDRVFVRRGEPDEAERHARIAAMRARIQEAHEKYPPLPMTMATDEYMAMIREPVPLPPEA